MAAEEGLKSSLQNLKPFESSGLSSDKATLLKPVETGCLDLFSKAPICTLTLDVLNFISATKELARKWAQYKSTRNRILWPFCTAVIFSYIFPTGNMHTSYLSFFLHEQNFWRLKFTPKKRVNYDKIHSILPIFCVITAKYTVNCQFFALNL